MRKARALKAQRSEEYQKAHTSTSRSQEELSSVANKQLEKKRRLAEEALQRVGGRKKLFSERGAHLVAAARVTRPHSLTVVRCKLAMPSPTLTGTVCLASLPPGRGGPGAVPELCG